MFLLTRGYRVVSDASHGCDPGVAMDRHYITKDCCRIKLQGAMDESALAASENTINMTTSDVTITREIETPLVFEVL
jgi:hypothetical protein